MPGDKKKMADQKLKPIRPDWDALERLSTQTNLAAIQLESTIREFEAENECNALLASLMRKNE